MEYYSFYTAARDGKPDIILDVLSDLNSQGKETIVREILNHRTRDIRTKEYTTPLIIAAKNGRTEVVKVLLDNFHADTEETGVVHFDGEIQTDVTALWCAAWTSHLDIAKLLVEHGANITRRVYKNCSPVMIAAIDGSVDMLKYLLTHINDMQVAQQNKNTCLSLASSMGHLNVTAYLIEAGADPNNKGDGGKTALHLAVYDYENDLSLAKLLVENGAHMKKNDYGVTPLNTAAALGHIELVDYLKDICGCTRQEKIEVLELLGASFTNRDNYDIAKCYNYFHAAMLERYKDPDDIIEKVPLPKVPAYDNKQECKTLAELKEIESAPLALHMESLAARERILGLDPLVPTLLNNNASMFYDQESYEKCITLWLHSMKHMLKTEETVDINGFVQVYDEMVQSGLAINFELLVEVFQCATFEIKLEKKKISEGCTPSDIDSRQKHYTYNIESCIYLISVMLRVANTKTQKDDMHRVIHNFIQVKPVLENGFTPLHMCCDGTYIRMFRLYNTEVASFPFALLCKTLVICGACANAIDNRKNTPLHILAKSVNRITNIRVLGSEVVHEGLTCLIENGAHVDSSNLDGETPLDVATNEDAKDVIKAYMELRLKCLAARAIKRHEVRYQGVIPPLLQDFVELH